MSTPPQFEPLNDLERKLLDAQEGRLSLDALMDELTYSQVCALIDREVADHGTLDSATNFLFLPSTSGDLAFAIFTNETRATKWAIESNLRDAVVVDFKWWVEIIPPGVGIVINPGWGVGFEAPASTVERLKRLARGRTAGPIQPAPDAERRRHLKNLGKQEIARQSDEFQAAVAKALDEASAEYAPQAKGKGWRQKLFRRRP